MSNAVKRFWQAGAAQAAQHAENCEVTEEPLQLGNPCARYTQLQATGIDGKPFVARVVRPVGEGPHPAVLMFHDANRDIRGWHHMTRFVALGYAVVALQNRSGVEGVLVSEPLAVGDGLGVAVRIPTCDEPLPVGRSLSPTVAQELGGTLCDALVLARLMQRMDGIDGSQIVTWGEGLGGGLALAVASLVGVRAACALNPLPAALDEISAHSDMALIVEGLDCPVLMGTCALDLQASVQAQDVLAAGLNNVRRITYPRYAHERVNAFEDEMMAFLAGLQKGDA